MTTNQGRSGYNAPDHNSLSWTGCYDDKGNTHLSDKQNSGWFPKEPKQRTLAVTQRRPIQRENAVIGGKDVSNLIDQIPTQTTRTTPRQLEEGDHIPDAQPRQEQDLSQAVILLSQETDDSETSCDDTTSEEEGSEDEDPDFTRFQELTQKRYDYKTDKNIWIKACATSNLITQFDWVPNRERSLHPWMRMDHPKHHLISWASCVYNQCVLHFKDKAKNGAFPMQTREVSDKMPYLESELRHWRTFAEHASYHAILLVRDERYSEDHEYMSPEECQNIDCKIHRQYKLSVYTKLWPMTHDEKGNRKVTIDECKATHAANCTTSCEIHREERTKIQKRFRIMHQEGFSFKDQTGGTAKDRAWYKELRKQAKWNDNHNPGGKIMEETNRLLNRVKCKECTGNWIFEDVYDKIRELRERKFNFDTQSGLPEDEAWYRTVQDSRRCLHQNNQDPKGKRRM
jgi:hypothetical protein